MGLKGGPIGTKTKWEKSGSFEDYFQFVLNIIFKIPLFVPFGVNLNHFLSLNLTWLYYRVLHLLVSSTSTFHRQSRDLFLEIIPGGGVVFASSPVTSTECELSVTSDWHPVSSLHSQSVTISPDD